jgi:aminoglycoside phosphotransferase (APT) family kinase protein
MNQLSPLASKDPLESYPGAQREVARATLKAVFGATRIEAITRVVGGVTTALTVRVKVGGRDYLLRVEGEPSPLRNPHQYKSMQIAAEAGIAPKIHYLDETVRVVVMDFVALRPLQDYPGGFRALARALGELLKQLQTAPVFPHFVDYPDIVARLFAHVRRTGLIAGGLLDAHVAHLERVSQSYSSGLGRLVSSHNDAHPGNLLFDGTRLWLIDWESAYCNDPLVDLATLIDSFAFSPELKGILVNSWLGRAPDDTFCTRLATVRALTRLYYAGVFLSASAASKPRTTPDLDLSTPTIEAFKQSIREGHLKAGSPEVLHTMGKMYLASFLSADAVPGFGAVVGH